MLRSDEIIVSLRATCLPEVLAKVVSWFPIAGARIIGTGHSDKNETAVFLVSVPRSAWPHETTHAQLVVAVQSDGGGVKQAVSLEPVAG